MALKIAGEILTPAILSGQNIVSYNTLTVKANTTTTMMLISAASYTLWVGYVLDTEMVVLLTDSLSTADWKAFLRTERDYGRGV